MNASSGIGALEPGTARRCWHMLHTEVPTFKNVPVDRKAGQKRLTRRWRPHVGGDHTYMWHNSKAQSPLCALALG